MKKLKPGVLLQINHAFDFLWRGAKTKDHFSLYIPVFEETLVLVLKTEVLCGDFRYACDPQIKKNVAENPEFYKNLQIYDIVTPLTPCIEVLHEKSFLYLECGLLPKAISEKWITIINAEL